jgi:RHS repeat-associated protein
MGKNRLTQAAFTSTDDASQSYTIAYGYDYTNHRISRTLIKGSYTDTRGYLYYGNQLIEETKNGSTLAMYGWDQQGLISRTDANGNSLFYLWDGLGNCIGIIDQNGRLAQSYEYSAYGENLSGKDAVNAFRFVGRFGGMQNDDTGLTYFWNRWYDSQAGRWMCEDPIRQSGGVNLYLYSVNKPVNLVDVSGLILSQDQVANIIFNEIRSLYGAGINRAYENIANTIINGDIKWGVNRMRHAHTQPSEASPQESEQGIWDQIKDIVDKVFDYRCYPANPKTETDPTSGSIFFQMLETNSSEEFNGRPLSTQDGPFDNSFPRDDAHPNRDLPAHGNYVDTY